METKFQYTVLVYTQGREIPDELTIEVAENNLRLNKCLKDKIANYIKPGHFIYSAQNTITIDGEKISTNKVIEDEGTIPTTNFIARLRLEPKIVLDAFVVPSVTQKRSYNRSQSKSPYSQNQGSGLNRSQELVSSTTENNGRSKKRLKQIKEDDSDVLESVKNKQSISNVSAPTFEEIMQQKGYCIIENSTEIPVPHTCQCDKQLKQQESFNWFQYQKEPIIRMDFPFVENELLAEPKATKLVVNHFKQVFKNELDHFGYEIIDVSSGNKLPLSIKFNTDHKIIETINGRTDVVIAPKGQSELNNICIGIEIKTPVTISCPKSFRQFVLQFIGALIKFSNIPMLFLSTDLETFKFLWLSDPNKKIIRLFQTRDYRYSIYFMKQFIAYHHDHRSISIDYKSSVITPNIKSNKEMNDKERKKKVEEAYESYSAEGKLEKFDSSRTESVFKIEIEEKPYVLKMANYHSKRNIYKELEIEHEIYEYLSNLREEIGDCFPQLYYAGPIRDGDFAIVTSYIEGKRPAKNWTNPWESKLCKKVLDKINSAGVLHGDARSANFIIVDEQPYTNEFDTYKKTAYILDFGFSQRFYFPQKENLKPDK